MGSTPARNSEPGGQDLPRSGANASAQTSGDSTIGRREKGTGATGGCASAAGESERGARGHPRPDSETLKKAFSGDSGAFQKVVEQLWGLIYVFIRQRVSDRGRAEDLTQDTFLQGWEKRASLRDAESAISWLLAIASRKVIDAHRWHGSRPESRLPERLDPSAAEETGEAIEEERAEQIRTALGELPELYRTVLILRYWSGLTPAQIARLLAEPKGTIRNRIFRAHLQLRREMNQNPDPTGENDSTGEAP